MSLENMDGAALQGVSKFPRAARLVFRLQSVWTWYYRMYMLKIYLLESFKSDI